MSVHLVLPAGYATRPSGGNVYGRLLLTGLRGLGRPVVVHEVEEPGGLPRVLSQVPDGSLLLVDGLVGAAAADRLLPQAGRLRLVLLVHMLFGTPHEVALLRATAAVVATSPWTRRRLVEEHGLAPERVRVAVPGADVAAPAPGTPGGGELLCVAAVTRAKGQDVLLPALARLRELDWRCTVAGPVDVDPDFVDEVRKQTADLGLADRVVLTGTLAPEEVAAAYARSDLLVLPSRAETYGMVVSEALGHGVPVVATAVGGVPEALGRAPDGSVPGLLVPPDDPAALAAALRGWLTDPSRRERLRASARARRTRLPTWAGTCAEVADVLDGVA